MDLFLPQHVGVNIFLRHLTSTEGTCSSSTYGWQNIYLSSLASADGLILPQHVGNSIDLSSLTSADGLILPQHVGNSIDLSSLASAKGLVLLNNLVVYI